MTKKFSKKQINAIASLIRDGGLVAIMSDTVYGLAADSSQGLLYDKLMKVKMRPSNKPLPLMVSSYKQIEKVADLNKRDKRLIRKFMPGACTFIFNLKKQAFPFLKGQKTIGIRMTDDPWVIEIIEKVGSPIWLPSANLSGNETAVDSDMVLEQLEGKIDGIVLGKSSRKQSSSVFDLTDNDIVCLREGPISLAEIKKEEKR